MIDRLVDRVTIPFAQFVQLLGDHYPAYEQLAVERDQSFQLTRDPSKVGRDLEARGVMTQREFRRAQMHLTAAGLIWVDMRDLPFEVHGQPPYYVLGFNQAKERDIAMLPRRRDRSRGLSFHDVVDTVRTHHKAPETYEIPRMAFAYYTDLRARKSRAGVQGNSSDGVSVRTANTDRPVG